jgi:hypothetical protein
VFGSVQLEFIRISNFVEFKNFASGTSLWSWVDGVELVALEIDSPMLTKWSLA